MGNRQEHEISGFAFITGILTFVIILIILLPVVLTFFSFEHKAWLLIGGMVMFHTGVWLPDIDHDNTKIGGWINRNLVNTRHRGHFHSIGALFIYTFICLGITFALSFIGTLQFTVWLTINSILGFLGYWDHLACDFYYDHKKNEKGERKKIPKANRPFKLW